MKTLLVVSFIIVALVFLAIPVVYTFLALSGYFASIDGIYTGIIGALLWLVGLSGLYDFTNKAYECIHQEGDEETDETDGGK